ncbi:MAG TPA: GAF domain-containing protein, partial [Pyrinomonadaceae bacterium]|nr:GAF domain-containing protein [Pyrinomonadaceae bacterium]
MRIQKTSHFLTLVIVTLSVVAATCAFWARQIHEAEEKAYEARRRMSHATEQLADGSDRLTATVRGYAATGDRRYFDLFQRELTIDRNREKAIEELRRIGLTPQENELLTRAKRNSDRLVVIEDQALAAAATNNLNKAIQTAFGPEYDAAKSSIMEPIAECRRLLERRLTGQATALADKGAILATIALSTLVVNSVTVLMVLILFYRKRVIIPVARLNEDLRRMVAGEPGIMIGYQEELSEIGDLARWIEKYRLTVAEAERERRVKTAKAEISDAIQAAEEPDEFGRKLLSKLVPQLGGGCGAFFLFAESENRFAFTTGYGLVDPKAYQSPAFEPNQGVGGQAAVERSVIILADLPSDYIRIGSGLGAAPPRVLVAIPIKTHDKVLAVVEIASFTEINKEQLDYLDELGNLMALHLQVMLRNLNTRALLAQV